MPFVKYDNFKGISTAVSKRDNLDYLQESRNLDSNVKEGSLTNRKGTKKIMDDATTDINKFIEYRDQKNSKDVILALDKDSTVANRKLWAYTRTEGSTDEYTRLDGAGPPDHSSGITYGNVELGDSSFGVNFMPWRNQIRIGTGTGANNKALMFGYWDRDNFFNQSALDFSGYFITKQQWVQKSSLFNVIADIKYDSTREKYYVLTIRGLEIRDTDWHIERIINDVVAWYSKHAAGEAPIAGGLALDSPNDLLYVAGRTPSATSNDTKVIRYDLSAGYEIGKKDDGTVDSYDQAEGDDQFIHDICYDGTYLYCTHVDSNLGEAYVREMDTPSTDLSSGNNRYTDSAGNPWFMGITYDGTNVYVVDANQGELFKMLKANPYTATVYTGAGTNPNDIHILATTLYWTTWGSTRDSTSTVESIGTASLGAAGAITPTQITDGTSEPLGNASCIFIRNATNFFVADDTHDYLVKYSDLSGTVAKYYPGKISLTAEGGDLRSKYTYNSQSGDATYFYAVSVVDIWGQEHHLMNGSACVDDATPDIFIKIWLNIKSEDYEEQSASVASGITALNSRWNDFRRIDKIKIYRAYSSTLFDKDPTSSYRFLKEIDFDDTRWVQVTANELYSFSFADDTPESEISIRSYEESSGLPEYFKPYYNNWKHAIEQDGIFYYGNLRTDDLYIQKFIQTPKNCPDVCYETDVNSEVFGIEDGSAIQGFAKTTSRIYVLKRDTSALYYGLNKDKDYNIGTIAPESIINFQDLVYFLAKDGFYVLSPPGEGKISLDIDSFITSQTNAVLEAVTGTIYMEKEKLMWYFGNSDGMTWCYNYKKRTWDQYFYAISIAHFFKGLDNRVLGSISTTNKVLEFFTGYTENADYDGTGGSTIAVYLKGNVANFLEDVLNAMVKRAIITFKSGDSITLTTTYRHESSSSDSTVSTVLSTNGDLTPKEFYLDEIYVNSLWPVISNSVDSETEIDNIIYEYDLVD